MNDSTKTVLAAIAGVAVIIALIVGSTIHSERQAARCLAAPATAACEMGK